VSNSKPQVILTDPSINEAEEAAKEAISRHKTLLIVGNCRVLYTGRAESKLEPGERILIVKQDGSLLVHRSVGYEPVNWQPPGCIFHSKASNGMLEVHAVRRRPDESIRVFFDRIRLLASLSLADSGQFSLYASEEDMQKAILAKPSLVEEGFRPISYEKKVEPGFVDVYGVDKSGKLVVVEIKRNTAGKEAALQLAKYVDAIRLKADRDVRGVIAAPNVKKDMQRLLATLGLEFKQLDPKLCAEVLQRSETVKLSRFLDER
jgi:RecB family endonuclease NucS